jgi:N6-adenosine-specific RNA methylase IME4
VRYGTVLADPPWNLAGGKNGKGGWSKSVSPSYHYPFMKTDVICAMGGPLQEHLEENGHLWLWVPNCLLPDGLRVLEAWGYRYSNNVVWNKTGAPGLGQRIRTTHEMALLRLRGKTAYARDAEGKRRQILSSFTSPRGRHSAKPPEMRSFIEKVSPGPYLELFARERCPGWDAFGNEVESSLSLPTVIE